eukprot:TRINITY_DN16624_c0_g1_i1.p1 TRINITY_DN16624_c0_g1~~TRINITY_DN16624_c0_g1_i1.p1  ORF type:complete len:246 (+),score=80.54 TRINITY_DN16624_c0_g1_i1:56-793(+)
MADRERERQRDRDRDRERERGRDRDRDRERERGGDRDRDRRDPPPQGGGGGLHPSRQPGAVARRRSDSVSSSSSSSSSLSSSVPEKEKAQFASTGLLAEDEGQTYKGRTLKWTEPADMERTQRRWVLYVLRDGKPIEGERMYELQENPAFMFGRDAGICDFPLAHPSISSQHAVLVFRATASEEQPGKTAVTPYVIDLDSTNGTSLNKKRLRPKVYTPLGNGDMLQFGNSSREFVLIDATDKLGK